MPVNFTMNTKVWTSSNRLKKIIKNLTRIRRKEAVEPNLSTISRSLFD